MKVTLSDDVGAVVEQFAKAQGTDINAAVDRLMEVAVGRLNALRKYAKAQKKIAKAEEKPAKKVVAKKPAKKAPKKVKEPEVVVEEAAAE